MIPRKARPNNTKVTGLTPDNVKALEAAHKASGDCAWDGVQLGASVAYWLVPPAGALRLVNEAIRQAGPGAARPLHAVRRKLEKQATVAGPEAVKVPDAPKASKRLGVIDCDHDQREGLHGLTELRAKCLCCGLVIDRPQAADRPKPRQRPARPGVPGVTTAQVVPADQTAPGPENATQPGWRYITAWQKSGPFLIIQLTKDSHGEVIAWSDSEDAAQRIVRTLNRKDSPQ